MKISPTAQVFQCGTRDMVRSGEFTSGPLSLRDLMPHLKEGFFVRQLPFDAEGEPSSQVEGAQYYAVFENRLIPLPGGSDCRLGKIIEHDVHQKFEIREIELENNTHNEGCSAI